MAGERLTLTGSRSLEASCAAGRHRRSFRRRVDRNRSEPASWRGCVIHAPLSGAYHNVSHTPLPPQTGESMGDLFTENLANKKSMPVEQAPIVAGYVAGLLHGFSSPLAKKWHAFQDNIDAIVSGGGGGSRTHLLEPLRASRHLLLAALASSACHHSASPTGWSRDTVYSPVMHEQHSRVSCGWRRSRGSLASSVPARQRRRCCPCHPLPHVAGCQAPDVAASPPSTCPPGRASQRACARATARLPPPA